MEDKNKKWLYFIVLGAVCAAAGFYFGSAGDKNDCVMEELRNPDNKFGLISPLIDVSSFSPSKERNILKIKEKVEGFIKEEDEGKAVPAEVSVYFRDLNNGPWFGIKEKEDFVPASLLKVPLLMAYLKKAEVESGLLDKKIFYGQKLEEMSSNLASDTDMVIGREYTVNELLEIMITKSNNEAKHLLLDNVDLDYLARVYEDLGAPAPDQTEEFMTAKAYGAFFRILYNASYLDKEMSEKALEILSRSSFDKGLTAGVPEGTVVANKFGDRGYGQDLLVQLHDCGIIYHPRHPYLLCVMTKGEGFIRLERIISNVSKIVYENIE